MRGRRAMIAAAVGAAAAGLVAVYLLRFGPQPLFLAAKPVDRDFAQQCATAALRNESWVRSACQVALAHERLGATDARHAAKSRVELAPVSPWRVTVTVHDRACRDDSMSESYVRLTLELQNGGWVPVKRECAWKGRGRAGWTTDDLL